MGEMLYKVGDRVQIVHRKTSCPKHSCPGWTNAMDIRRGGTMTILEAQSAGYYRMEEDGWNWCSCMIEGLSTAPASRCYKVGDRVQIVSQKGGCDWNEEGYMDRWLGQVMTIRKITGDYYYMEEDIDSSEKRGGWSWYNHMIAGLEDEFMFEPATDDEFANLLA